MSSAAYRATFKRWSSPLEPIAIRSACANVGMLASEKSVGQRTDWKTDASWVASPPK